MESTRREHVERTRGQHVETPWYRRSGVENAAETMCGDPLQFCEQGAEAQRPDQRCLRENHSEPSLVPEAALSPGRNRVTDETLKARSTGPPAVILRLRIHLLRVGSGIIFLIRTSGIPLKSRVRTAR